MERSDPLNAPARPARAALATNGGLAHWLHALLIVALPTLALLYACWAAAAGQVRTWQVVLMLASYFLTTLAITVGYHRMLTHYAFQARRGVKAVLTIVACMAAQGPPLYWVSNHRRHHRFVDRDGDPHSPLISEGRALGKWRGFWHAHVGWTFGHGLSNSLEYCPDLLRDPVVRWVGRHYFKWLLLGLVLPGVVGYAIEGSWRGFALGVVWGGFVRMFVTNQLTNGINSAAHLWGYQRYALGDSSRNNWFLGIFTLGEGWHNNHHASGTAAVFSRAWYEIDIGGAFVLLLERLGLVHDVRRPDYVAARRGTTAASSSTPHSREEQSR